MKRLIFRAVALADIDEAYRWYEKQRFGLGMDFMAAIEQGTALIEANPEQCPRVRGKVRRLLLKKFPYGLFYIDLQDFISVIAVLHQARDPKRWQQRARTSR